MRQTRTFLVVADDPDRLLLLSTTLHRKFPNAVVETCRDGHAALEAVQARVPDAIIATRSTDFDELPLVEALRRGTTAPIVLVSGSEHESVAASVGASAFLDRERWLLIGKVVAELIGAQP